MVRYYILFENYEQGLRLHELLDGAGVMNRIAPAPAAARGKLCCGMSLLVEADAIDAARDVIAREGAAHHSIVPMEVRWLVSRSMMCR